MAPLAGMPQESLYMAAAFAARVLKSFDPRILPTAPLCDSRARTGLDVVASHVD